MLRSLNNLIGYKIEATDSEVGVVQDFYFHDDTWTIRYLVVDTGNWLPGRLVLLSPVAITAGEPDWSRSRFPVNLTRKQVEKSPSAGIDRPVSRQFETDLHQYYGWPVYWGTAPLPAQIPGGRTREQAANEPDKDGSVRNPDPDLRSAQEVNGYHIQATDGEIGHVEDFIIDTGAWLLRYLVIDTRNWLPGRKVLVSPDWLEGISWSERIVKANLTQEEIKDSPEFDSRQPVNREYEVRLYDYYGRPAYW
jgi:hypothetical protein